MQVDVYAPMLCVCLWHWRMCVCVCVYVCLCAYKYMHAYHVYVGVRVAIEIISCTHWALNSAAYPMNSLPMWYTYSILDWVPFSILCTLLLCNSANTVWEYMFKLVIKTNFPSYLGQLSLHPWKRQCTLPQWQQGNQQQAEGLCIDQQLLYS